MTFAFVLLLYDSAHLKTLQYGCIPTLDSILRNSRPLPHGQGFPDVKYFALMNKRTQVASSLPSLWSHTLQCLSRYVPTYGGGHPG